MEGNNTGSKFSPATREKFKMTPPADGWNRLEAELEKKQGIIYKEKASRFRMLSILLALLLLCSVSYFYFIPHGAQHQQVAGKISDNKAVATAAKQIVAPAAQTKSVSATNSSKENPIFETPSDSKQNTALNNASASLNRSEQGKGQKISHRQPSILKIKTHPVTSQLVQISGEKQTTNNKVAVSQPVIMNEESSKKVSENNGENTKEEIAASLPIRTTDNQVDVKESGVSNVKTAQSEDKSSSTNVNTVVDSKPAFQSDEMKKEERKNNSQASIATTSPIDSNSLKDITKEKAISRWSISAFYSPAYSKNRLEGINDYGLRTADEYMRREKPGYSYETGLAFRFNATQHWSISAGGSYSNLAYSIVVPVIHARTGSDNEVHYYYPTSCGLITVPTEYSSSAHAGDSLMNASCTQIVKFINIPFIIRYQLNKGWFTFYAEAGASVNFAIEEKANVWVGSNEASITNNIFGLKKMNYGYIAGLGAEYNIARGLGVFLEPVFRGSFNTLTAGTPYNCYPYTFALNAGVTFHF